MIHEVKDPVIEAHNLTVAYDRKPAIWNIDFTLPAGQIIGIMGPNGSGKSTLLKSIMGVVKPDTGWVHILGSAIDHSRKKVSYVPQRQSVDWDFPATVWDVVAMGRYALKGVFKKLNANDRMIIEESLKKVKMYSYAHRQISQLSGGQQQRAFLARALAQQADIYLMDEPFAGVDVATEEAIVQLLRQMRDEGKTVVVVHHDLHTAKNYFEWLVLLNTRLVASGPLAEVFDEESLADTYGGTLTTLTRVAELLDKKEMPIRHK